MTRSLTDRLESEARDETAKAGRVTNPAFPKYWGADIIQAHLDRAALLREAKAEIERLSALRSVGREKRYAIVGIIRAYVLPHHYEGDPPDYWTIIGEDAAADAILALMSPVGGGE